MKLASGPVKMYFSGFKTLPVRNYYFEMRNEKMRNESECFLFENLPRKNRPLMDLRLQSKVKRKTNMNTT